ncbi:MAG: hypothetical protein OCD76_23085 [Reichenbachiella sp.]
MSENANFLKFLINEDIYPLQDDEAKVSQPNATAQPVSAEPSKADAPVAVQESAPAYTPSAVEKVENPVAPPEQLPKNQVVVLFSNSASETMKVEESAFLLKILSAVKMNFELVDMVNVDLGVNKAHLYKKVVAFTPNHGLSATQKYQTLSGDQQVLLADDLTSIASSQDLKKQLWGELQKMFG